MKRTGEKRGIRENDFFVNIFRIAGAIFKCGRIIYWFFDKWVEFLENFLRASFMMLGRSS